jgi:hypothetical protein
MSEAVEIKAKFEKVKMLLKELEDEIRSCRQILRGEKDD